MPVGRPKGSSGINKSKLIREFMESHPEATNKDIIDGLSSQGVEVSAALVGGVRSRANGSIKSKEITISEINNIRAIVERFEDESIIMGIIDDLTDCIKEIGGIPRFQAALAQLKKGELSDSSESEDSDEDSDEEDSEMPESDSETVSVTASTSEYDYQDEDDEEDED